MIFFQADGRLGNQLFQYAFLKKIRKGNETIVVSNFLEIQKLFSISDIFILPTSNRFNRIISNRLIFKTIRFLAEKKFFSYITTDYEIINGYRREATTYSIKNGFFKNIRFLELGFFQSESCFDSRKITNLKIKEKHLHAAKQFLKETSGMKVFIHIRLGDYQQFKVYGKSVQLPFSHFQNQIKYINSNYNDVHYVFLSDQPQIIELAFENILNKTISHNPQEVDFAIMTLCDVAILSPSSFGWWGSYFMTKRKKVIVPKYWMGFNSNQYYHAQPIAKFMTEIDL
jgi:hypothetical protein